MALEDLKRHFESYLNSTVAIREEQCKARDYYDGYQWTAEETEALRSRQQAPIVNNRIKPKIEALQGMERQNRTDPQAFPRTPQHEDGAHAITDALRFVADNNDFDQVASDSFENMCIEGTEAAIVETFKQGDEIWIGIRKIHSDRFYYDHHSQELDFSDAMYMGIAVWMDAEDAIRRFPGSKKDLNMMMTTAAGDDTLDDKPSRWVDTKRKRLRICQHFHKEGGVWHQTYFTESAILKGKDKQDMAGPSPFVDEFGEPMNPIVAQSAYIDRENDRYGHVRILIDIQDEVNHRHSKALYMLSHRTIIADAGAVDDKRLALKELSKAQGFVEVNPGTERFDVDSHAELGLSQFQLLQEAKQEIDAKGPNEGLQGQGAAESGRARLARQQAGLLELGTLFDRHRNWKREIYRQVWYRVKQFWTAERWIRVTDEERNVKFVGLNQPISKADMIKERIESGEMNLSEEQALTLVGDPRLEEVGEVRNSVEQMQVDIIVAESPDTLTIQQEQFEVIAQLAQAYPQQIPFEMVLELSSLRNKQEVLEKLKGESEEGQQQQQLLQQQLAAQQRSQEIEDAHKLAQARKANAEADAKLAEVG